MAQSWSANLPCLNRRCQPHLNLHKNPLFIKKDYVQSSKAFNEVPGICQLWFSAAGGLKGAEMWPSPPPSNNRHLAPSFDTISVLATGLLSHRLSRLRCRGTLAMDVRTSAAVLPHRCCESGSQTHSERRQMLRCCLKTLGKCDTDVTAVIETLLG